MFPPVDWALVWNTLFDKLVLAAVLLALGYVVNRRLERFKSREALRKSMAEHRLPKIAEHVARFSELRADIDWNLSTDWQVAQPMIEVGVDTQEEIRARHFVAFQQHWDRRMVFREEGAKRVEEAAQALQRDRFWLGSELCDIVLRRYDGLALAFSSAGGARTYGEKVGIVNPEHRRPRPRLIRSFADLRSVLRERRDRRMLERYGLSGDFKRADVDRMIDRVSNTE